MFYSGVYSQSYNIKAFLDTNIIDFADQTVFHIQVKANNGDIINFPVFDDTISNAVELVEHFPADTIKKSPLTIDKKYLITAFEDSLQTIDKLPVLINKDTFFTNKVQLIVSPFQIDSSEVAKIDTNQIIPIFDIKNVFDAPITFKEFWMRYGKLIIIILIIIALIPIAIWLIKKYKKKEPVKILAKPKEPAHIIAFRNLQKLKKEKLAEKGKFKEYYSKLTDIIRTYIEQRYRIPALERTTNEIITDFRIARILNEDLIIDLQKLLNMADLAKFAKFKPSAEHNTNNFELCENFIDKTKIEVKKDKIDDNNIDKNNSINKNLNDKKYN